MIWLLLKPLSIIRNTKEMMKKISNLTKKQWVFVFFLGLAFSLWLFVLFFGNKQYADEYAHNRQIRWFLKGNYGLLSDLTTIPGYHVVIAIFSKIYNHPSLIKLRAISFSLSSISILVFYLISRKFKHKDSLTRTLQFVFLPISFFYFPLLYTDIFSLLMVLLAFYFAIKKQYKLSAFFSLTSLLVRQNNIIWVFFTWIYEYVSTFGFSISRKNVADYLKKTFGYLLIFVAFAAFVFFNKGVAIGDAESHQAGFYMGNIYFFLAMIGFLFFPFLVSSIHNLNGLKNKKTLIFGIGAGALIASSFAFFPPAIHPYNLKLNFLRNIILQGVYHKWFWSYVMAIFVGYMTIFLMKFEKKNYLFFPFIFLSLLPAFLIEQRYAIVSFVFLLLLRKEESDEAEKLIIPYFFIISIGLIYMLLKMNLFF